MPEEERESRNSANKVDNHTLSTLMPHRGYRRDSLIGTVAWETYDLVSNLVKLDEVAVK